MYSGSKHWPVAGAAAGLLLGVVDHLLLRWLGLAMRLAGHDVTLAVMAMFGVTYAFLGYTIGRLAQARGRLRADAAVIGAQLVALERTQAELVQSEKLAALGRVAAGIAHEVRNPLGVIRSSASMVREVVAGEPVGPAWNDAQRDVERACGFMCEEIDRLNGLITGLLTFARPARLQRQPVRMTVIIDRALELLEEARAAAGVRVVRRSLAGPLAVEGDLLEADPDLVAQVVYGLCGNAVEAVPPGGTLELRLGGGPTEVLLEIADDGPGVGPDDVPRLFEPFFTTKPRGTGLGLATAGRIAQAHGGQLSWAGGHGAGAGGQGACFRLQLPRASSAAPPEEGAPR